MYNCYALILAAGASRRMGACKASLPWVGGTTLLTYQVHQWMQAGVLPLVVLGPHNAHLEQRLPPSCQAIVNPQPDAGKTSSLLIGLQAVPSDMEMLAIAAVDQPRPASLYSQLLQAHQSQNFPITVPIYQERMGHPILFHCSMLPELYTLNESTQGLRRIIKEFDQSLHRVPANSPIVLMDLNTIRSYQTALREWQGIANP